MMAEVELDESGEPQARQLDQVSASILSRSNGESFVERLKLRPT